MGLKFVQFTALLLLLLVTGLFWGTWFALSQSIANFSPTEFIHIGKTIITNVAFPMRIILPLCILAIALAAWLYPEKRSTGFYFTLASLLLIILSLFITVFIEVPIDNQIKLWTTQNLPANWETLRGKWQYYHSLRTLTSIASFSCFVIMTVFYKPKTAR